MAASVIKSEPCDPVNAAQICRLCMSDENLGDVFNDEGLNQWISDLLSITIFIDDRLSKAVCVMCRLQVTEFHRFKMRCSEVQHVLKSQYDDNAYETRNRPVASSEPVSSWKMETGRDDDACAAIKIKEETNESTEASVFSENSAYDQESFHHTTVRDENAGTSYSIDIGDSISVENVKIETPADDGHDIQATAMVNEDREDAEINQNTNNADHTCDICHKVFPSKVSLRCHRRAVHEPKNHACQLCGFQSSLPGDLKRHLKSKQHLANEMKSDKQQFQCDICEKVFPDRKKIRNHERVIHGPKRYSCPVCDKPFAIRNVMERHRQTHQSSAERREVRSAAETTINTVRSFKCNICQKMFKQKRHLANHQMCVHGPKQFECSICGCKFALRFHYNAHMQRHARHRDNTEDYNVLHRMRKEESANNDIDLEGTSGEVDKAANSDSDQINQESAKCTECNKEFKYQNSLFLHFKYVHKEKLQCSLCSVKFVTQIRLTKHMLLKHKQEDGSFQPLKCEACDRVFPTTTQLSQHMVVHREKVFGCTLCSKSFYRHQHLTSHMRAHKDLGDDFIIPASVNRFECAICHKVYKNRKVMQLHIRKEHGSELHECSVCSKLFKERSSLSEHMMTHSAAERATEQLDIVIKEEPLLIDDDSNGASEFPSSSGFGVLR